MAVPQGRLVIRAALFVLILLSVPYFLLSALVTTREFKTFAEKRVGEILKTEVSIGRIRVGFFNKIILSGFQIRSSPKKALPGIEVEQIIFRYQIKQLLQRKLTSPDAIILKSPKLTMKQAGFPAIFLQGASVKSEAGNFTQFELAGGEIHYEIPMLHAFVDLKDIRASFSRGEGDIFHGVFRARMEGLLEGVLEVQGDFNPKTGEKRMVSEIRGACFSKSFIPNENSLDMKLLTDSKAMILESMMLNIGGQKTYFSGKLSGYPLQPAFDGKVRFEADGTAKSGSLTADLTKHSLQGDWKEGAASVIRYTGEIFSSKAGIEVKDWKTDTGYTGYGKLNFDTGEGELNLQRGVKRLTLSVKNRESETDLGLKVDHVNVAGIDLVTSARIHLNSDLLNPLRAFQLEGNYETDYLILDTIALQDFKGDFELSSQGVNHLNGSWGKYFKLTGNVNFADKIPDADLSVRVSKLDLNGLKKFANKPLPKDLGGLLSGKMKVTGPLNRPRFAGRFTVNDGWLGKVDFEKAIIQFDGLAPSFKLLDSRVYRGRGTLLITGAVDLQAQNIMHAVNFETQDHIVVYRGLDVTLVSSEEDLDLEVHPGVKKMPAFGVKAGVGSGLKQDTDKDKGSKNKYLEAGPRFKF